MPTATSSTCGRRGRRAALIDNPRRIDRRRGRSRPTPGSFRGCGVGLGPARAFWRGDSVRSITCAGTNVVRTVAQFVTGEARLVCARGRRVATRWRPSESDRRPVESAVTSVARDLVGDPAAFAARQSRTDGGVPRSSCRGRSALPPVVQPTRARRPATRTGSSAPRSRLLALDRSGAALGIRRTAWARADVRTLAADPAGADRPAHRRGRRRRRDGWAYVWPRDAGTAALAYAAAGYRGEAGRVAGFLSGWEPRRRRRASTATARRSGRGPQGDAAGWIAVAAAAAGLPPECALARPPRTESAWPDLPDYQEGSPGDYLGNAIADGLSAGRTWFAASSRRRRGSCARRATRPRASTRRPPGRSGPFPTQPSFPPSAAPSCNLAADADALRDHAGRRLAGRRRPLDRADRLERLEAGGARRANALGGERRRRAPPARRPAPRRHRRPAPYLSASTPATGVPRSTTPLAWSHAFAILALRQLWPRGTDGSCGYGRIAGTTKR